MAIAACLLLPAHPLSTTPCRSPLSNPYLRFSSAPLLLRSPAAATFHVATSSMTPPPRTPLVALARNEQAAALPDPEEPRKRNPVDHPAPLLAAVAAAAAAIASPAALALSGGSMGGCSSSSSSSYSSSSSSSSSSYSSSSSSSSGDSWWSTSSSSSSSPKTKKTENNADLETHESVGTATSPPPQVVLSPWEKFWLSFAVVLGFVGLVLGLLFLIKRNLRTTSVIKLQVALRGTAAAKSFQKDLNKIAEKVGGSSPRWYKFILTETISSLRRHKDYYTSTSLSVDEDNEYSWNDHFKKISLEERSKFDEESLSNLEGIKRKKVYSTKTDGSKNEYIVLTILVAADGTLDFPQVIRSSSDLEAALAKLNSTPETDLQGVYVLWAPQDEDDILSSERMKKDYSYLKPLSV